MASRITRSKSKYFPPKKEIADEEFEVKAEDSDSAPPKVKKPKKLTISEDKASKYWPKKKLLAPEVKGEIKDEEHDVKLSGKSKVTKSRSKKDSLPDNWQVVYENIVKMRAETPADVDTMGCDQCVDKDGRVDEKTARLQCLVSLMLSSQTRDPITFATMERLKEAGLSVQLIESIADNQLEELIKPVSFYRNKTKYLKKTATILREQYDGDIPRTLADMLKLPGVGPKMAHLAMKEAWGEVTGIAVDTHVHRIANRLQWVSAKTPEQTMEQLQRRLPRQYWDDINHLLVGFGQAICLGAKPKCATCLNASICPASTCKSGSSKYDF